MALEQVLYIVSLGLAVAITLGLAILGYSRYRTTGARLFSGIMLAGMVYALGSIFEIQSRTLAEAHAWLAFEYLGITTIGPFWLLLARLLSGTSSGRPTRRALWFFLVPLVIVAAVITNDWHQLYYTHIVLHFKGPFTIPDLGKGPLYWLNMVYMNGCILAGSLITLQRAVTATPVFRKQALLMFSGSIMPWLGMLVYQLGVSPFGLDVSPFGVMAAGLIYAWGLFRYRLLDLPPIIYENVFAAMRDAVLVVDQKGRLIGANPACLAVLPELSLDRIGENIDRLLVGRPAILACLSRTDAPPSDLAMKVGDEERHFEVNAAPLRDSRKRAVGTILNLNDISARVALMAEMEKMASTDVLTGLANRRTFMLHAGRELERARRSKSPVAMIMMDLDHFKAVNDKFGHQAGDAVLIQAARICQINLRLTDLACRYGGEEFLVLLPGSSLHDAGLVAERIRQSLSGDAITYGGQPIHCSASLGISQASLVGPDDLDRLIAEADSAMYAAKAAGRNTVRVHGSC